MLITLTIIGVIAAITIPTLMKNYEKRQIEVGLAKTYQELSNIIKRSEIDNGPFDDWESFGGILPSTTKKYIDKYFAPYMRLIECNNQCFSGKKSGYYGGYLLPDGTVQSNISATYFLPDGRTIQFYNFINYGWANGSGKYVEFVVDVNGHRGKSILGEDVFGFVIGHSSNMQKGLQTGTSGSGSGYTNASKETLYSLCSPNQNMNGLRNCSIILQRNGWKFPDDYPIKF